MYIFELTDNAVKIYNQKKKTLIIENIPENIIKNNKVYDYLKLVTVLNRIVNKYKIINSLFRIKVKLIVFERLSPSEVYLYNNAFKSVSNIFVEIIDVNRFFNGNFIFISGEIIYYDNKKLKNLKRGDYILVGNSNNYDKLKNDLIKKYKVNILEYENSNTFLYEKVWVKKNF